MRKTIAAVLLCSACGDTTYVFGDSRDETPKKKGETANEPLKEEQEAEGQGDKYWPIVTDCETDGLALVPGEGLGAIGLAATAREVREHFVCEPVFDATLFAYRYPDLGLFVVFGDADLNQVLDDTESVLDFVVETPFAATTDSGLGIASTRADLEKEFGLPVEFPRSDGSALWYVENGLGVEQSGGAVVRMAIFRRQPGILTAAIDPITARLGEASSCELNDDLCLDVQAAYTNSDGYVGTTLAELRDMLASATPDIDTLTMSGAGTAHIVDYAHLGITAISLLYGAPSNVSLILLHEPYSGTTPSGNGIRSLRADIEAEMGASTSTGTTGETVYSVGTPVGLVIPAITGQLAIVYDDDRAKTWVLNYMGL